MTRIQLKKKIFAPLGLFLVGFVAVVGLIAVLVNLDLLGSGSLLAHWESWLVLAALGWCVVLFARKGRRSFANGAALASLVATLGALLLGLGQMTWGYTLTGQRAAVLADPKIDVVFVGSSWQTTLGRAHAGEDLRAFHSLVASGWWNLLSKYGVSLPELAGCRVTSSLPHATHSQGFLTGALASPASSCPGWTGGRWQPPGGDTMVAMFAPDNAFAKRRLSESGWNSLVRYHHRSVHVAIVLPGSLEDATIQRKLGVLSATANTTATLSHELAESITGLGPHSYAISSSTFSRFTLVAGATLLYISSAQFDLIHPFYESQPTDIMQIADVCSPDQPAFVPSHASSYRIYDGTGMVSLWDPTTHSCANAEHGIPVPFQT